MPPHPGKCIALQSLLAPVTGSRHAPNILVIDVNMPEMDGLSVCDHLQDADQAPANVIVITGSRHPHTLERCERIGTYCARKGPNFWNDLKAALAEIDPRVALLP